MADLNTLPLIPGFLTTKLLAWNAGQDFFSYLPISTVLDLNTWAPDDYYTKEEIDDIIIALGDNNRVAMTNYIGNDTNPRSIAFSGDFTAMALFAQRDPSPFVYLATRSGWGSYISDTVSYGAAGAAFGATTDNLITIPGILNESGFDYYLAIMGN